MQVTDIVWPTLKEPPNVKLGAIFAAGFLGLNPIGLTNDFSNYKPSLCKSVSFLVRLLKSCDYSAYNNFQKDTSS